MAITAPTERTLEEALSDDLAERAVLGTVFCDPPSFAILSRELTVDDFSEWRNRDLWAIMARLFERGTPPDLATVGYEMRVEGVEKWAPLYENYLAGCVDACAFPAYGLHYAGIVADLAERRRFMAALSDGATAAHRNGSEIDAVMADMAVAVQRAQRVRSRGVYRQIGEVDDDLTAPNLYRSFFGGAFQDVDRLVGGMEAGQMIVIGARTGVGKTATLLQMLWQQSDKYGTPVGIVSLEMPARSIKTRLVSHIASVDMHALKSEDRPPTDQEYERLNQARKTLDYVPIFVDEDPRRTLPDVVERIRAMVMEQRVRAVGVDYLQLLADNQTKRQDNRSQELSRISGAMKQLALELNIPIICLAQINRVAESRADGIPKLSDLKDSGSIEQDADVVILLHDDTKAARHCNAHEQIIRFEVAKNRNGATGVTWLEYMGPHLRFSRLRQTYRAAMAGAA